MAQHEVRELIEEAIQLLALQIARATENKKFYMVISREFRSIADGNCP